MPSHQNNHAVLRQNTETGIEIDTTTQCRFQIEKYEDTLYEDALAELKQEFDNNRRVSIKMKIQIRKLLAKVECVNTSGSSNIVELTNILTKTQELLEHALEPSDYQKIANGVEGSPSQGMRAIGGIMLAICAIAVALAAIATAASPIAIPIAAATAVTFLMTGSVCFFSGRRHGLSEILSDIASEAKHSSAFKK